MSPNADRATPFPSATQRPFTGMPGRSDSGSSPLTRDYTVPVRELIVTTGCRILSLAFRPARRPWRPLLLTERLVVIKPASLGDVLMATPTLCALRQALPRHHLAFAVSAWAKPMVAGNHRLDSLVDLGRVGSGPYGPAEYLAAARRLRAGHFAAALVLDRAPLVALLPLLAGIPRRIGLDSAGRGFSLTLGVPCPPRRHEVELYLDVVRAAGYPVAAPRLEFFPTTDDEASVEHLLAGLLPGSSASRSDLVAVHPGGGANPGMTLLAKRWPTARFAAIVDRLHHELHAQVLIVGGASDAALAGALRAAAQAPALNLAGRLSLGQLGALLRRCRLLVANDTGAAHLATAVGTPAVVLFGPTDPDQYGPYNGLGEAVIAGLSCSPCFRLGHFPPCPNEYRCLVDLDPDVVWPAVLRQWLARQRIVVPLPSGNGGG